MNQSPIHMAVGIAGTMAALPFAATLHTEQFGLSTYEVEGNTVTNTDYPAAAMRNVVIPTSKYQFQEREIHQPAGCRRRQVAAPDPRHSAHTKGGHK